MRLLVGLLGLSAMPRCGVYCVLLSLFFIGEAGKLGGRGNADGSNFLSAVVVSVISCGAHSSVIVDESTIATFVTDPGAVAAAVLDV